MRRSLRRLSLARAVVDVRSDTVTPPTAAMRSAMAGARVGDDVMQDDPTVLELERRAARETGLQAALFVPSGTMGNLLALMTHCGRGDEFLVGDRSHIFLDEVGGSASVAGVHAKALRNMSDGSMLIRDIENAIAPPDVHYAVPRLICLENSQNHVGGVPLSASYTRQVAQIAHSNNMMLHVDGARLFNAAVALGEPVRGLVEHADSATFCLSKGLAAPVGSILLGKGEFIARARRFRKMLGGGMRQVGILAAAGIEALETGPEKLVEDHKMAKLLAKGIVERVPGLKLRSEPYTNMVFAVLEDSISLSMDEITERLKERGILVWGWERSRHFRFVTHYQIREAEVERLIRALQDILRVM